MESLRTIAFGFIGIAVGVLPWFLDKRGITMPSSIILYGGILALAGLSVGIFPILEKALSRFLLGIGSPQPMSVIVSLAIAVGLFCAGSTWWIMIPSGSSRERPSAAADWSGVTKTAIVGKTFVGEEVPLDGFSYSTCVFKQVTLVWKGEGPFDLTHNDFQGSVNVKVPQNILASALLFKMLYDAAGKMPISISRLKRD